ncbi:MAG: carboxypeptidase-like regulatory domain-containing protein [Candidatus Hadarchaeales archaeon]
MRRLGGIAIAAAVLLALAVPAGGVPDKSFKYVKDFPFQWISGTVVDNCGLGVENATVVSILENGDVHSTYTDENGNFAIFTPVTENTRYTLIFNENHTGFNKTHEFRGFESSSVEGWIDNSGSRHHTVVLDYDPFDVSVSVSHDPVLEWSQVVVDKSYEYRLESTVYGSKYNVRLVGGHVIYTNQTTTDPNYYRREYIPGGYSWSGDYDYYTGIWVSPNEYVNRGFAASSGVELGLHGALRNVRYTVERIIYDGHYRTYRAGYWTNGGYRIYYVPGPYYIHFCDYYVGGSVGYVHGLSISPQTFTITESEYRTLSSIPLYANNGSFVRVDTLDYVPATGSAELQFEVFPKNGYAGSARLVFSAENGLGVSPSEIILTESQDASTAVDITENASNSPRRIFVKAYDNNHNLVEENIVSLNVKIQNKPNPLTLKYLLSSSDSKIEIQVFSEHTGALLFGAFVSMRLSNGALFISGYTDNQGKFVVTPSEWPLNVNLDVEVSYPKYVTKHITMNTGHGGWKYASVYLNCGDFILSPISTGFAVFYSSGFVKFIKVAMVNVQPGYLIDQWAGGDVSLATTYDPYYFSYAYPNLKMINPSLPNTIEVYGWPKMEFINAFKITLTGVAGPPSNYVRRTDVGYSSKYGGC